MWWEKIHETQFTVTVLVCLYDSVLKKTVVSAFTRSQRQMQGLQWINDKRPLLSHSFCVYEALLTRAKAVFETGWKKTICKRQQNTVDKK